MLVSFLAALEDGVSFTSEIAEKQAESKKSGGEGSVGVKLPSLATLLGLSLAVNGKYSRESGGDQSTESKFVREHTSASLFNRLRARLHADGLVVRVGEDVSVEAIKSGDIVELAGQFEVSPMRTLVEFMNSLSPFVEEEAAKAGAGAPLVKRNERKGMSPEQLAALELEEAARASARELAESNAATMRMVKIIESDLDSSPVIDLIFRQSKVSGIVTASREYFNSEVAAALVGGQFSFLGKVTAVDLREDAQNSVVRRGGLGPFAKSLVEPLIEEMREKWRESGAEVALPGVHLNGYYIQVIPLAIFV
ncbi:hypothetical protein AB0C38_44310 [Amycolatopsis sp. NPDC048633]|uniref:DUF6414 family protein n=1 Tax=Amycolatopsis sp. NPDC048633 TaxID=3157095 RepID=UPI00340876C6